MKYSCSWYKTEIEISLNGAFCTSKDWKVWVYVTEIENHKLVLRVVFSWLGGSPQNLFGPPKSRTKGSQRPLLKFSIENLVRQCSRLVSNTESSPNKEHSSWSLFFMAGTPASCDSSLRFSSLKPSLVAVSNSSHLQPPSPSNCSRWVWYFLES